MQDVFFLIKHVGLLVSYQQYLELKSNMGYKFRP